MKTKPVILLAALSTLAASSLLAQDAPPPGDRGPRDGERPRGGPRDGDRAPDGPRDGERPKGGPRDGDGPRTGPRDGERPRGGPRDGEGERAERRERDGEKRPFLGVMTAPLSPALAAQLSLPEGFGLIVQDVMPESPAAKAGVQKYDILKLLNDQQLVDSSQLMTLLKSVGTGKPVSLTLLRKGQEQKVTATVEEHSFEHGDGKRRGGELEEKMRGLAESVGPEARDRMRDAQERIRGVQEQIERKMRERRQQEMRGPGEGKPEGKPGASLDQLLQPKDPLRVVSETGVTTLDESKARIHLKDDSGEIEVMADKGGRVLKARDRDGKIVFDGPVNTPEERRALPEDLRRKLENIKIQQDGRGSTQVQAGARGEARVEVRSETKFQ